MLSQLIHRSTGSDRGVVRFTALLAVIPAIGLAAQAPAQNTQWLVDAPGDARIMRIDPGADGPVDTSLHPLPDLLGCRLGAWEPADPQADLFEGQWLDTAEFFRLDMALQGVINPPGTLGADQFFDPFLYGPAPLFGYVELDLDADVNTGGELSFPELRFNGNAARWGALPVAGRFVERLAFDASAFDQVLATPPYVDRSGEELHVALNGAPFDAIVKKLGNPNDFFQAGEIWILSGRLLHRAHGYEPFSFACCCHGGDGHYLPMTQLQFAHDAMADVTTVSVVFPLTNAASAAMRGDPQVEPLDGDACNQASVLEALDDLAFSATNAPGTWRNDPDFALIADWEFKQPAEHLSALDWQMTALLATSYTSRDPDGIDLVWTDLTPDGLTGDVDGDGDADESDRGAIAAFIALHDGEAGVDEDGRVDGSVDLINFGPQFFLFDVNYDGRVDAADGGVCTGLETMKLKCRRSRINGKLTNAAPGATATLRLDDDPGTDRRTIVNEDGLARFSFRKVAPGRHEVAHLECRLRRSIGCE